MMKKYFLLFVLIVAAFITTAQEKDQLWYLPDSLIDETPVYMERAGSCGSPDGPMNSTTTSPPSYAWLQTNGYCNPNSYGTNPTVCWTFTPTSTSVTINSGYSQSGCANVSFGPFTLYDNSCSVVGTGLNFTGLIPGNTYTWCMTASAWGGGPSCTGFDDFCPYYFNNSTLPIELISFEAKLDGTDVDLTWQTASEINNDFFTIERSETGIDWEEIVKIDGAGNSNIILRYEYTDDEAPSGMIYYRLKQTDFDGKYEYSDIESVENTSDYFYFWTSADGNLYVSEVSDIKIYNTMGSLIKSNVSNHISTDDLSGGLYIVRFNNSVSYKFFVK